MALGTALWALMTPGATIALGLGDIETRSALNQPLRAEIQLLSVRPGEMEDLVISLAPEALFRRLGIERTHLLSDLRFEPVTTSDGRHVIRVTSRNPIREPFLNFLIEASWPSGRLVREYTVLLDPPTLFERAQPPVTGFATAPADRVPMPPTTPRPDGTEAPVSSYRVRAGDTMWGVGTRLRPDEGITVEQMMMALLRANPEAFADNNINNLLSGSVLRVPERDEILALGAAEARREVATQNRLWHEYRSLAADQPARPQVPVTPDAPPPPPPVSLPDPAVPDSDDGRLEIVAQPEAEPGDGAARLEQDLALLRETSESRRQETLEMRERIRELEDLLERQNRLLALNNDQLAMLQQQLAAARAEDPDRLPEPMPSLAPPSPELEALPAESPPEAPVSPAAPAPLPPPEPPVTAPAPQPQAGGFLSELLRSPSLLIGGGLGILLVLALVLLTLRRLRGGAAEDALPVTSVSGPESMGQEAGFGVSTAKAGVAVAGAAGLASAGAGGSDRAPGVGGQSQDHSSTAMMDTVETQIPDFSTVSGTDAEQPAEVGSWDEVVNDDIIAEADVYLAYGLYQQAEDLLKGASDRAPERPDYLFKLAETYFATANQAAFDQTAASMYQQKGDRDSALWDRVVAMGQELSPENSLYAGSAGKATAPSREAEDSDLILDTQDLETSLGDVDFDLRDEDAQPQDLSPLGRDVHVPLRENADAPSRSIRDPDAVDLADDVSSEDRDMQAKDDEDTLRFEIGDLEFDLDEFGASESRQPKLADAEPEPSDAGQMKSGAHARDEEAVPPSAAMDDEATWEMDLKGLHLSDDDETVAISQSPGKLDDDADDTMRLLEDSFTEEDLRSLEDDTESLEDPFGLGDEISTKLDLARAYIDMGDNEGARATLEEVMSEGDAQQKQEAQELLNQIA
nr:FimV/HubP family polar landmark protein [Ectothiorhodospira shaposhnikovii]